MSNDTAPMGHNNPPSDLEVFRERLAEATAPIRKRVAELIAAFSRVPLDFSDPTNVQRCTDFVAQCKAALKAAEEKRKELKKPLDDQAKAVQDTFKTMVDQLEKPMKDLEAKLGDYAAQQRRAAELKAKQEREAAKAEARKKQEEAEAQARAAQVAAAQAKTAEEADRAAQQMAKAIETQQAAETAQQTAEKAGRVEKTKLSGEYGSTGYASKRWTFEVENLADVPRHYMTIDETAIREAIKSGIRDIPGLRIYQDEKFTVKGAA